MNQKEIVKSLEAITRDGFRFSTVYEDWLELMTAALLRDDDTYLEVMRKYQEANQKHPVGQRPADMFAEAYANLCGAWIADNRDHLGAIYEEHVSRGEHGQFFTPEPLCDLMAAMSCQDLQPGQSVSDPACGSGRNFLAAARVQPEAHFYGVDIDRRCCLMATLNLVHRNLSGGIVWGDALKLEQHGAWKVTATPMGAELRYIDRESLEAEELVKKVAELPLVRDAPQFEMEDDQYEMGL